MKDFIIDNIVLIILMISMFVIFGSNHIGYKVGYDQGYQKGYETAVDDMYNGKLKCDRIEIKSFKYIWRKDK